MAESISRESFVATGLPGLQAGTRYVGATVSGAPTTGTYLTGDFLIGQNGIIWVCTVSGSPGTWIGAANQNINFVTGSGSIVVTETISSGTGVLRNIWVSSGTVTPTGGSSGDIWVQYT